MACGLHVIHPRITKWMSTRFLFIRIIVWVHILLCNFIFNIHRCLSSLFSFFACCFFNARVNFSFFLWFWSLSTGVASPIPRASPVAKRDETELEMSEGRNILVALPSEISLRASIPFNRRTPSLIFAFIKLLDTFCFCFVNKSDRLCTTLC